MSLITIHKTFRGITKKCENNNEKITIKLIFVSVHLFEMRGAARVKGEIRLHKFRIAICNSVSNFGDQYNTMF